MNRLMPPTDQLPHALYRAEQVRELDRLTIEEHGIPGTTLMERAGAAAFRLLCKRWPSARRVAILCGAGNNAGDGYVVARLALYAGMRVRVLYLKQPTELRGDALTAARAYMDSDGPVEAFGGELPREAEVLVDAVLGTGLEREVSGPWRAAIEAMNRHPAPVLALDIPSGLHADSGAVLGAAARAEATISFIGLKQGLFTGLGSEHCGEVLFNALDVPAAIYGRMILGARRLDWTQQRTLLAPRPRAAHKGSFGHVLVVGGALGYSGAARLAGEAAARSGAGLVSLATRPEHASCMNAACPELMCHGTQSGSDLDGLLERASVIAIGPGLGRSDWSMALWSRVLEAGQPLVVDADALNQLAEEPLRRDHWILTPHPGEAARLLGRSTREVQADRFRAAADIQSRFGGVCVLKGAGTVIHGPSTRPPAVCSGGNPGMASGGMGDVLTGVIAGLLAQGFELEDAACLGVCLHAAAADEAARDGERGLLASDLLGRLRRLANPELGA